MGKIVQLPEHVCNQIAAGEVVERPASVVKELLENSIDAGATSVRIELQHAGIHGIVISDNGNGMDASDAVACFGRHATSKLKTADDLNTVRTLGFRGEALPSIASVSQFVLQTGQDLSQLAVEVDYNQGQPKSKPIAPRKGTRIEINGLFYNVPARRKFLKSPATELAHIRDVVLNYALLYPQVALMLLHEGTELLDFTPSTRLERARAVFDMPSLVEQTTTLGDYQLTTYTPDPVLSFPNKQHRLFINGRPVIDNTVYRALHQRFEGWLPSNTHPLLLAFITLPTTEVDVNVHPAKREVKFASPQKLVALINAWKLVKPQLPVALQAQNPALPTIVLPAIAVPPQLTSPTLPQLTAPNIAGATPSQPVVTDAAKHVTSLSRTAEPKQEETIVTEKVPSATPPSVTHALATVPDVTKHWRFIHAYNSISYVFLNPQGEFVFVNAKHLIERLLHDNRLPNTTAQQTLLIPILIDLLPTELTVFEEHKELLITLGFEFDLFGDRTYRFSAVPDWFINPSVHTLRPLLAEGAQLRARLTQVRLHQPLPEVALRTYINAVFTAQNPNHSPDGYPIFAFFKQSTLERHWNGKHSTLLN